MPAISCSGSPEPQKTNFAFDRIVNIYANNFGNNAILGFLNLYIWLTKSQKQITGAGFFKQVSHG